MKEDVKIVLFVAAIVVMFVSSHIFVLEANTRGKEQIWRGASDLGYLIGYQQAEWDIAPFFNKHIEYYDGGEIYSIEPFYTVNLTKQPLGYYYNDTYYPHNITFYKIDLDLTGFTWCDPSPYVNPNGTRYATFRYCKEGPFTSPGYYKFHCFDVDFMEIINWEKVEA